MWQHAATRANVQTLLSRGVRMVGPGSGELACGEEGEGRMAEVVEIVAAARQLLVPTGPLVGLRALVTSGGTREPIDPVRFIANRSSGKQGHAVAEALAAAGATTVLVSGPTELPSPWGVEMVAVETAAEMLAACSDAMPVDVAVCAAAVADWRPAETALQKIKKDGGQGPLLRMVENPDILAAVAGAAQRPRLVVGFAAETENVRANAVAKRQRKGCDWIVANDVSAAAGTFGSDRNTVQLIDGEGGEDWPTMSKREVAERLVQRIAAFFAG
jgi:phosphopantothenoylcysteine decarboxylase/phosphopantothenate--cysteine ligase